MYDKFKRLSVVNVHIKMIFFSKKESVYMKILCDYVGPFGFIKKIRWDKGKYERTRELGEVRRADLLLSPPLLL